MANINLFMQKNKPLNYKLFYQTDAIILEAMSASGIRAIRYAKEITGIKSVIANDFSMSAVETIKRNSILNQVEGIVIPSFADAS